MKCVFHRHGNKNIVSQPNYDCYKLNEAEWRIYASVNQIIDSDHGLSSVLRQTNQSLKQMLAYFQLKPQGLTADKC